MTITTYQKEKKTYEQQGWDRRIRKKKRIANKALDVELLITVR